MLRSAVRLAHDPAPLLLTPQLSAVSAVVDDDGTGRLTIAGRPPRTITGTDVDGTRDALLTLVIQYAQEVGRDVVLTASDPSGTHHVIVSATGAVLPATDASRPAPTSTAPDVADPAMPALNDPAGPPETGSSTFAAPARRGAQPRSFLRDTKLVAPPPRGWRGVLARLGVTAQPSAEEQSRWDDERAIAQHWPGPRTIAVLNGKGGAGKTPATVLLSALFARAGGSGVLAWDNNVTRGTLGWRTETGTHQATILDLLPHTQQLLAPTARAADLATFVHHQTVDKYDVLRSNPLLLSTEQKITPAQLDDVHAVAAKYYRLIVMDSGNDEGDALWLRMIDHADQLVVATTTRVDHAEAGRLLLNALAVRDAHSARLAQQAVVIVSQADREEADAAAIAHGYTDLARAVVTVPYDPAMRRQWLRVDFLHSNTQRAYLRAAAAVARGL